jgi:hypothetical protein
MTLPFVDERQCLTVIQPVLPLHEWVDPAPTEYVAAESPPTESAANPAPVEFATTADPAPTESSAEPLHFDVGAAPTETS